MADIAQDQPKENATGNGRKQRKIGRTIGLAAAGVVLLAAMGAAIYALIAFDRSQQVTAVLRDLAIILLAMATAIIGLFLAILIFQLQSLIALLRNEIRPILDSANQTARTVRGTTTFVSDAVVAPVISVASLFTAFRETLKVLAGSSRKTRNTVDYDSHSSRLHSEPGEAGTDGKQPISQNSEGG